MEGHINSRCITLEASQPPKLSKNNHMLVKIEIPCCGKCNTLEALELSDYTTYTFLENIGSSKQKYMQYSGGIQTTNI